MKTLLIHNKTHFDFSTNNIFDDVIDIADFNAAIHENTHEKEIEQFEWVLEEVNKKSENIDVLVISNFLIFDDEELCLGSELGLEQSAFALALHVRFHSNDNIKYLPIIILSFKTLSEIIKISYDVPQIIATNGLFVVNPNDITDKEISTLVPPDDQYALTKYHNEPSIKTIAQILDTCSKKEVRKTRKEFLRKVVVKDFSTSNHDIANQWGAYRMAQVASVDIKDFKYPKTLYFKYLLSNIDTSQKFDISECEQFHDKNLEILFIDDNYDKGWDKCLKGVFEQRILKKEYSITIETKSSWEESFLENIRNDKYDLILLDYYLGYEKGIDILSKIKKSNPAVPVIMFTASNKAWNMDKLYEAGADGYYVKEHPDNAHDTGFSVENFINFHETVEKCLKKGMLLRQYWNKISQIKKDWNFTNKGSQKNKERIEERLTMFLGLLKKAYEQTDFDKKTFFYSEWELAFLTLWSTLNEIQEVYYEKVEGIENPKNSGRIVSIHPDGTSIISEWKIVNQNDKLLWKQGVYDNTNNLNINNDKYELDTFTNFKYERNKTFSVTNNYFLDKKGFCETRLFLQVAFLIKKKTELRSGILAICKNTVKKGNQNLKDENSLRNLANNQYLITEKKILDKLLILNNSRNHLYLTHGEDMSNPQFDKLYQEQRENTDWQTHIKQLFEIVYFLCTGKECAW